MSLLDAALPADWIWARIGDRFRITKKPKHVRVDRFDAIPFVPMESVPTSGREDVQFELRSPNRITSGAYFEKGDILLSKITPSFENGKQGLADNIPAAFGYASTEVIPLQPCGADVMRRFLFYYLLHPDVRTILADKMEGSTGRQRVPEHAVREFPFPVPPRHEQEKISALLWKVQHAMSVEEKLIAATHELKQAAMRQLFTRGMRGEEQRATEIGLQPNSWALDPIRSHAKLVAGGTPSRAVKAYWEGGTIPWVKTGEVDYCTITDTEEKITRAGLENSAAKMLPIGTLLVAMYGQGVTRGKVAILGIEACTNQACVAIISANDRVLPRYLYFFLTFSYDRLRSSSHGAQQQNLNSELVGSFQVPVPHLDEQRDIATVLEAIDRKIGVHQRKCTALQELFESLLHELMTGQIRVHNIDIDCLSNLHDGLSFSKGSSFASAAP